MLQMMCIFTCNTLSDFTMTLHQDHKLQITAPEKHIFKKGVMQTHLTHLSQYLQPLASKRINNSYQL